MLMGTNHLRTAHPGYASQFHTLVAVLAGVMPFIYEAVHNVTDVTHDPKRWETLKKEVMNEDRLPRELEGIESASIFWMKFRGKPRWGPECV